MNRLLWTALILLGSALAWVLLHGLHPAARAWTVLLLVPFPALMVRQAHELHAMPALPRPSAYLSSILGLWLLAGATLVVAVLSGYDARDLGIRDTSLLRTTVIGAAVTAAAIAVQFLFRTLGVRESPVLRQLLPVTAAERWLFVLVSISAGVCEELVFRGFLLRTLTLATGITPLAVLLSAGAFGVVHAYQQPIGAVRAAVLGILLTLPVLLGDSLVTAMLAHTLIDIIGGLWLARHLLR
ncbi:MAG TPA: CPBP family intramembrane glutamic endopeptidase [Longimicrobiales bacterium]|nr:CPBP family intramembrane glutamic endopeptidase [Longimicrobiales bacterium]